MNLRIKFLSLIIVLVVIGEALMYGSIRRFAEDLVGDLMVRYGQIVSKYDIEKTLAPLFKELDIAKELSANPVVMRWAINPKDPELYKEAKQILEKYRWRFLSKSYSIALTQDNGYYHNNAKNEFSEDPYQYTLNPSSVNDEWFFNLITQNEKIDININPDLHLGVTQIWINVLIENDGEILGHVGTGMDYSALLADLYVKSEEVQGVNTFIVDQKQIIKLHRKNGVSQKALSETEYLVSKRLPDLFSNEEDFFELNSAMASVSGSASTKSVFVIYDGLKQLAVVSHIPQLNWYEITFIDLETILPKEKFISLYMVFCGVLLLLVVVISYMLSRWVMKPLSEFESRTQILTDSSDSKVQIRFPNKPDDEIGALMGHFEEMAHTIQSAREDLELKVAERTAALDRLASIDPLTKLLNRRGMEFQLLQEISHAKRDRYSFGILWIDVDYFKRINDSMGHDKGDQALRLIAGAINDVIRDYDSASRWGGDEFLVLIRTACPDQLQELAERLRGYIRKLEVTSDDRHVAHMLSISVGAALVLPGMSLKQVLLHADSALYRAKSDGRNTVRMWSGKDETIHQIRT